MANNLSMLETLHRLLDGNTYSVAESFKLPPREARYRPIPRFLFNSRIGFHLNRQPFGKTGLWNHQALALEKFGEGHNIVISTGTASGKSLIFRVAAFHTTLLDPSFRVLAFYPLKALANDQLKGWRQLARELELDERLVGRIDGSVPMKERDEILEHARILICTPDVCHAWLMSRLSIPVVKSFIRHVGLIIMDEAHTLEGVFGSNFAFLLRRLMTARHHLVEDKNSKQLRLIAATATIANPDQHLQLLTGQVFEAISADDDGSPRAECLCAHVVSPPGEELQISGGIQVELLKHSRSGGFISFVDSRKGVELLARSSQEKLKELLGDGAIMPYRSGYDSQDREAIERRLQKGDLRGVVSTSALELGIDLPHLSVGINVGVPGSRKAYRQRLGRVGRSGPGAFLVLGQNNAFRGYGTSFSEYHQQSVEPSYLYLDNRFMQFAHARCLADELESLGKRSVSPGKGLWPSGFDDVYAAAKPGAACPPEFDAIAQLGGDSPQRSYPLRNVGELSFKIALSENQDGFGDVNESQALRECYPGATYNHLARAYEVKSWNVSGYVPYIKVRACSPGRQTKPRIRTWINASIMSRDLLDSHFVSSPEGYIAECQMQITERVEGYTDSAGVYHDYQDLRQRDSNMRPRHRNFRTSGVILCIRHEWFRTGGAKQLIASWLMDIFSREFSIAPQDVGVAATNISVRSVQGGGNTADYICVFDQTYGSLRLTERLFLHFGVMLERLTVSANSFVGEERLKRLEYVAKLKRVFSTFVPDEDAPEADAEVEGHSGMLLVFRPGSIVCLREKGNVGTAVQVITPTMMNGQLMYQVQQSRKNILHAPGKRWVSAAALEASADASEWEQGWWDAAAEEFVQEAEEEH